MDFQRLRRMPKVGAVMTPFPYFARPEDNLEEVERLMNEHQIRHIPVVEEGHVVGIASERDLVCPVTPMFPKVDLKQIRVKEVASFNPYVVEMDTPLDQVVTKMAESRIGSAIIVKKGKLVGILSVTDICLVLSGVLNVLFPQPEGDEAA